MAEYPKWKQDACEHCRNGVAMEAAVPPAYKCSYHRNPLQNGYFGAACTAPTEAQHIEQLTARVAELESFIQNSSHAMKLERGDSEAENARLRAALAEFADVGNWLLPGEGFGVKAPRWISATDENPVAMADAALSTAPVADSTPPADPLDGIRALTPNWDTYGAPAISPLAIELARTIATMAQFVPTSAGGVQVEWHINGLDIEVEIGPDGSMEAWNSATPEGESPADTIRKVLEEAVSASADLIDAIRSPIGAAPDTCIDRLRSALAAAREALKEAK